MKSLFITLFVLLAGFNTFSQTKATPEIESYFSAIVVTDIDKSIDWYSNNFGFQVLNRTNMEERGLKQANLKNKSILIELIEINGTLKRKNILDKNPNYKFIQGLFKFGFQTSSFDELINLLKENKVEFYGDVFNDPNTNQRMTIVKDPDNNYVQIFEK